MIKLNQFPVVFPTLVLIFGGRKRAHNGHNDDGRRHRQAAINHPPQTLTSEQSGPKMLPTGPSSTKAINGWFSSVREIRAGRSVLFDRPNASSANALLLPAK